MNKPSKSKLQKLIAEQKKDNTYFISPEKIRKHRHTQSWAPVTVGELINCLYLAELSEIEIISYLWKEVLGLDNRQLSRSVRRMTSHTTINNNLNSAKRKMRSVSNPLARALPNKKTEKEDEQLTLREEVEEMFKKHSLYETESRDWRKAPKHKRYDHGTDK